MDWKIVEEDQRWWLVCDELRIGPFKTETAAWRCKYRKGHEFVPPHMNGVSVL